MKWRVEKVDHPLSYAPLWAAVNPLGGKQLFTDWKEAMAYVEARGKEAEDERY